jgi:sec-independent protein translocase protein TatA
MRSADMFTGWERPSHWLVLAVLVAVLFGYKKLPDAARSVGRSLRIFKTEIKGMGEDDAARDAKKQAAAAADDPAPAAAPDPPAIEAPAPVKPAVGEQSTSAANADKPAPSA